MLPVRLTVRLTLSGFGLVSLFATASLWAQLPGLYGAHGLVPIAETVAAIERSGASFLSVPSLFRWLGASTFALHLVAALCVAASVCLTAGLAPRVACLMLFVGFLSFVQVGAPFLNFQWDILLLESCVVLGLSAPAGLRPFLEPSRVDLHLAARLGLAVLCCKVTLGSGLVKLLSGDPSWRDLTALTYHWWSQPLPTWTSVLANALPLGVQKLLCGVMFVLELVPPLLVFGPRRARLAGALGLMLMQVGLLAFGNYSYFNALTLVLAVPLLDNGSASRAPRWSFVLAAFYAVLSVSAFARRLTAEPPLVSVLERLAPFHVVNAYGAFAVMTKTRAEIIVEGSEDGRVWKPYEFRWKPGRLERRPDFVAPWQPRLDWQMWFASLGSCAQNPWFLSLQQHLLEGTPEVLALLDEVPFQAPPRFMRSTSWEYRFAPLGSPTWWTRTESGPYCPPLALTSTGQLRRADELER